jgi:EpsI family protein
VYALIVIGIETRMQHYLIQVEHLYFGWAIFILLMLPTFLLGARWSARTKFGSPVRAQGEGVPAVSRGLLAAAVVAGLMLLAPRALAPPEFDSRAVPAVSPLPAAIGGATRGADTSGWAPRFQGAWVEQASYTEPGVPAVVVLRAMYPHQTREQRLVRGTNVFYGPRWQPQEEGRVVVHLPDRRLPVTEGRGYLTGQETLIWSWFVVAGRPATTKLGAKLLEAWGLVQGRRDAAAFGLATACVPNCATARGRLQEFAREAGVALYVD